MKNLIVLIMNKSRAKLYFVNCRMFRLINRLEHFKEQRSPHSFLMEIYDFCFY